MNDDRPTRVFIDGRCEPAWYDIQGRQPDKRRDLEKRPFYYGWIIVVLGFLSLGFWLGIISSFSVFYATLLEEFDWLRAESAGVISTSQIAYTLTAPFVGALIHRFGPRKVVVPGILMLAGGLALCATVTALGQLYVYYGLFVGFGASCISMAAFGVIISRWFDVNRGLANGIASSGMGVGMFILVPLSQKLISTIGWQEAYLVLALLAFIILFPANLLFLKHRPQDMGLLPDGKKINNPADSSHTATAPEPPAVRWTWPLLVRTPRFYAMMIFPSLSIFSVMLIIVHNMRFFLDQGIDEMTGAYAFAIAGVATMVFRIVWGWLSDHIGRELAYTAGMVSLCMGIGCLLLLESTGQPLFLYMFAVLFGMGWGANAPLFVATAADLFKGPSFGLLYGLVESLIGLTGAFSAWTGGYIYDTTHSYRPAFILTMISALLSAVFIWLAAPRKANRRHRHFKIVDGKSRKEG